MPEQLLTPKEVAAKIQKHVDTLYDWLKEPSIPEGVVIRPRPRGSMLICWSKFENWHSGRR